MSVTEEELVVMVNNRTDEFIINVDIDREEDPDEETIYARGDD